MKYTGKIIVLAFPDTFVTMSTEWVCKLLPLVGLGTKEYIKAGHAALILVENATGKARYFDFGRYVTPKGNGRVRGANTDIELAIPFDATISSTGTLNNLDDFLLWLDANPQKTHGQGRLLGAVCHAINYEKANHFIKTLQKKGSIPYGAFNKEGSNCARFVTDTILAATDDKRIKKALCFNKKFTPSAVGNVEKAAIKRNVYEVFEGKVQPFNGSAFKENLTNYFDKKKPLKTHSFSEDFTAINPALQKLSGIGSSAWFELSEAALPKHHFNIKRYNELGEVDFNGVYTSTLFNPSKPFTFTYDSHCEFCHVIQENRKIKLACVSSLARFNSLQTSRSA